MGNDPRKLSPIGVSGYQQVQDALGPNNPTTLISTQRDPGPNAAVGGVKNSQHLDGSAVDISVKGMTNEQVMQALQLAGQNGTLSYDQLINEGDHVHVGFAANPRGQSWTQINGTKGVITQNYGKNGTNTNTLLGEDVPALPAAPASAPTPISIAVVKGVYSEMTRETIDPVTVELQVDDDSLNGTPWFNDSTLITGNIGSQKTVQPVSFTICLNKQTGEMLTTSFDENAPPVELRLNTSLKSIEIQSKHIVHHTPSRTGQHVTFWGMQPDMITGTGSTGVFMNQYGLTDYFSVAQVNDDIKALVTKAFTHAASFNSNLVANPTSTPSAANNWGGWGGPGAGVPTSSLIATPTAAPSADNNWGGWGGPDAGTPTATAANNWGGWGPTPASTTLTVNTPNAFRVAAQDAFVEFLKMFQMNGNVYFQPLDYTTSFNLEQKDTTAWSSQTGASTLQMHARSNDVFSRGYIIMSYKNNKFLGYFKALSWTMDAEKPFQWQFNFVFQVERTITSLYTPPVAGAINYLPVGDNTASGVNAILNTATPGFIGPIQQIKA